MHDHPRMLLCHTFMLVSKSYGAVTATILQTLCQYPDS
jgi:hypothetical protein